MPADSGIELAWQEFTVLHTLTPMPAVKLAMSLLLASEQTAVVDLQEAKSTPSILSESACVGDLQGSLQTRSLLSMALNLLQLATL